MENTHYLEPENVNLNVFLEFKSKQNYVTIKDIYVNGSYYYYDEEGLIQSKQGGNQGSFRLYANEQPGSNGEYSIKVLRNPDEAPKLIQMDCGNNQLTAIHFLQTKEIQLLYCQNNLLTSIDISSFAENLASFDCSQNQINALNLSACQQLEGINCEYNPITSLDISPCLKLNDLEFSNTQIRSVWIGNSNLRVIHCYHTPLVQNYDTYRNFLVSLPVRSSSEVGYISPYPREYPDLVQILNSKNWVEG